MCIAIVKPKGIHLPESHIEESFLSNPDGAGFAVATGTKIVLRKGYFSWKGIRDAFAPYQGLQALVHFRIATSGGVSTKTCHPFLLAGGLYALIHNGIISIDHDKQVESDTMKFCNSVLSPLLEAGVPLSSPALRFLVEETIGKFNKIAVMSYTGETVIFNEQEGHTEKGIWYSNYGYLPYEGNWKIWSGTKWVKGDPSLPASKTLLAKCEVLPEDTVEYCWYCGDMFAAKNRDELLCATCKKEEEAVFFTNQYNRR